MRPVNEGEKNFYVVMEGKEFRKQVGGLIEVPIGEDDEEYAKHASEDEDDTKGKGNDKVKTKDAVRDLKKF